MRIYLFRMDKDEAQKGEESSGSDAPTLSNSHRDQENICGK